LASEAGGPSAALLYYDQALTLSPGLPGVVEKKAWLNEVLEAADGPAEFFAT
jgi:hypothetical protein